MQKIGFIGAGNMAKAIISGIYNSEIDAEVSVFDIDIKKAEELNKFNAIKKDSIKALVKDSNYLFLAIKPQNFPEVLSELKTTINHDIVIVSIAAGITPKYISKALSFDAKVIQVMPNTPLMLSYGATALSKADVVDKEEFTYVKNIFDCAGISEVIPNNKMNEIIAINGSSPAFIYQYAQYFINYGKSVGLDEQVCTNLFAQTLIGSAKMITDSGYTIDELIKMVSSKGGTTIAGLEGLKENNLEKAVNDACEKCIARAYELSKE